MATLKEIALAASTLGDCESLHNDDVRRLGKAYLNDIYKLEAQHRKTWALAMEHGDKVADRIWREHQSISAHKAINAYRVAIRETLPCPPIEATQK
jgi:hypothetical protein